MQDEKKSAAHIVAEPGELDFGSLIVGSTSAPQVVTLTNNGSGHVTVESAHTSTSSYAFSTTCSSLAAGQSCTISVRFSPENAGVHADALTVDTVPAALVAPIALAGTGIVPKVIQKDVQDTKPVRDHIKTVDTKVTADAKNLNDKSPQELLKTMADGKQTGSSSTAGAPTPPSDGPAEEASAQHFIQSGERPAVGLAALEESQEQSQ